MCSIFSLVASLQTAKRREKCKDLPAPDAGGSARKSASPLCLRYLQLSRDPPQDTFCLSRIESGRQAALGHVGGATSASTQVHHGIFQELAHVEFLPRTLRKHQRRLTAS